MSFDFETLVTDRTDADVRRWLLLRDKGFEKMTDAERTEWLSGSMKGAYNKGDLNRVGECLNYLYGRLYDAGYITPGTQFQAKTNWTVSSIPTANDFAHYLRCVGIIRGALATYPDTPPMPESSRSLTHAEANDIERILLDVRELLENMLRALYVSGDLMSGEI